MERRYRQRPVPAERRKSGVFQGSSFVNWRRKRQLDVVFWLYRYDLISACRIARMIMRWRQ